LGRTSRFPIFLIPLEKLQFLLSEPFDNPISAQKPQICRRKIGDDAHPGMRPARSHLSCSHSTSIARYPMNDIPSLSFLPMAHRALSRARSTSETPDFPVAPRISGFDSPNRRSPLIHISFHVLPGKFAFATLAFVNFGDTRQGSH
jgi:hypothetical protein